MWSVVSGTVSSCSSRATAHGELMPNYNMFIGWTVCIWQCRSTMTQVGTMFRHSLSVLLLFFCGSLAIAQGHPKNLPCAFGSTTTVEHNAQVTIHKVTLSGSWGSAVAMVYVPDKEVADGAVVFSHSSIHADTGTSVSLLPFALTLAHAGAAVIVPQRTLVWLPTSLSANREAEPVVCAEHWLIDHTKVFNNGEPTVNENNIVVREGYAYVGPRLCDPEVTSDCNYTDPFNLEDCSLKHYCRPSTWVPVGETEGGDNTNKILSDGGLWAARSLQRVLKLAPIEAIISQAPSPQF
jgi:hypothetical protein